MDRRKFLQQAGSVTVLLAGGQWFKADAAACLESGRGKVVLRFAVASDGHYGQPGTPYQDYYATLVRRINETHQRDPFRFTVINGDIIHDDPSFFVPARQALDGLHMKYYVSQGNHDHCSRQRWQEIWGMPVNLDFHIHRNAFLIATTSDEKGAYLCPDLDWMAQQLRRYRSMENIFIFLHINPAGQTANAVSCAELTQLFSRHNNIRAVFNGHDHDKEGILVKEGIPYIFDAHFGGNWGTAYRGFRVVELLEDQSLRTFILNPDQTINEATLTTPTYER